MMGHHTSEGDLFALSPPALAPSAGKPKRHPCRAKGCATWVTPHHLLCDSCWRGAPAELRRAFLETRAHTPERAAAAMALTRGAGPNATQHVLPGVPVRRRFDLLSAEEMAAAAAQFIGPPTAEERRRKAAAAACDEFNSAHPLRSHVEVQHGGRCVAGTIHGAAAALPPSWRPIFVLKLEAGALLQLPLGAVRAEAERTTQDRATAR